MLAGLLFIIFAVAAKKIYRCLVNPVTVFCSVWGVILLGYSVHAYGLYYASSQSIRIIVSGVIMFFVGSVTATVLYTRKAKQFSRDASVDTDTLPINYGVLLFLNIISFIFLIGFGITVFLQLLSGKDFHYIHKMYNEEEGILGGSVANKNMITWFVWPLMHASLASVAVMVQCDKSKNNRLKRLCIFFILANLALFTLISGKRSFLAELAFFFIAVFWMQGKRTKLRRRTKFFIAIVLVLVIMALEYISSGRGAESITRTIYFYLCGCVPHLSVKLQGAAIVTKGVSSIYGFYQAPLIAFNVIARIPYLSDIRSSMSELAVYTQERVYIGTDATYNAFLSPFYYFYTDGGMAGNLIFSFLFGLFATYVYHNHLKKRSYKSMTIYLIVFFSLYLSMVRMQYFQMRFVLSFVYVFLFFKRFKYKIVFGKKIKQINSINNISAE